MEGETITAAANGKVSSIYSNPELGTVVVMELGNGYELTYGQLKDITVSEGGFVNKGDIIGSVAAPTKYYSVEGCKIGNCEKRVWKDRFIIDCGKGVAINMRRYLLNGRIMTMASEKKGNRKNKVRPLYENGYLLIEKGKIAAIGDMEELGHIPKKDGGTDVIDVEPYGNYGGEKGDGRG